MNQYEKLVRHTYSEDDIRRVIEYMDWYDNHSAFAKPDREFVWEQVDAGEGTLYMRREDKVKFGKDWEDAQH